MRLFVHEEVQQARFYLFRLLRLRLQVQDDAKQKEDKG